MTLRRPNIQLLVAAVLCIAATALYASDRHNSFYTRAGNTGDVQNALHADERGIAMHLFVRKNKDDKETSKEFYYLGHLHATGETKEFTMPGTKSTAVEIAYQLETPVQEALYEYIVG